MLYAFVDTAFLHGRAPEWIAQQLCAGGADLIQLRAKGAAPDEVRRMADAILPVVRAAGVPLVINDFISIAREVGADYCHLGQEDFFGAGHRRVSELQITQGKPGIGLSTHSPAQAQEAIAAGADYLGVGPVFPTGTKPEAKAVTLEYVRWAARNVKIPWYAIGGINLDTLDEVLESGARGVCVVSAILKAGDIAAACRQFKRRMN